MTQKISCLIKHSIPHLGTNHLVNTKVHELHSPTFYNLGRMIDYIIEFVLKLKQDLKTFIKRIPVC